MDIVGFELWIFRIKPKRNVHDHPEIDVKLHEKVSHILLKSLFCSVPFLGLTHSHRAFQAGKTLAGIVLLNLVQDENLI